MDTQVEGSSNKGILFTHSRILKNVFIISIVFFLLFVSFQSLQSLQSSLHLTAGIGTISLSCIYGAMAFSCLFVPQFAIQRLGHKWCITVSLIGYLLWMAANGYAGR